jgi:hypothetical protein
LENYCTSQIIIIIAVVVIERGSHYIVQAGLKLEILLSQPPYTKITGLHKHTCFTIYFFSSTFPPVTDSWGIQTPPSLL